MSTIPNEFLCPIGLTIMKDPVIGPDGHTYELTAITEWLVQHDVSPITRQQMSINRLRPNIALRKIIEDWLILYPQFSGIPAPAPLFKDVALSVKARKHNGFLHLQVAATGPAERQPIVFIAIVDNSGSMGEEASGGNGGESFGFTRMDLVKHTINTMAAILGPQDQLAIVTFSTNAKVVLSPTFVNDSGRAKVQKALEMIEPDSQTNIYDGIRQAAMIANQPELAGRNIVAALLTDGFPNVNPPRGILETLKLQPKQPSWTLHTFGFGYKLDSRLLADIALWGNGLFGFIPDCSMVGTVFINFIANMLTTASLGATLFVDGKRICFTGPIRHQQTYDQVVKLTDDMKQVSVDGENYVEITSGGDEFTEAYQDYLAVLKAMIDTASSAPLAEFRIKYEKTSDERIKGFLIDTDTKLSSEGQVSMSTKYWGKWGEHYLRSYYRAQELQQSLNFKDVGLQIYGGDLFHAIQTEADTAFCTLPAPKPSALPKPVAAAGGYYGAAAASAAYSSPATMVSFHNPSGGCFAGSCQVKMADGSRRAIKNILPGSSVWTPTGAAKVVALVTCGSKARSQPMVHLGDLCITPWHPILMNQKWVFPADLTPLQDRLIDTVYNLVLDSGHIVDVEGYECVTLGHGFQEPVVKHDFFGTDAVINDLKKLPGWSVGLPVFKNLVTMREEASGLIIGWVDKA